MEELLPSLVQVRMCLDPIGREISSKMDMAFLFRSLVFLAKQCVPSPPNNIIVGSWSLRGIFKTWQQALNFLVVETSRFIG